MVSTVALPITAENTRWQPTVSGAFHTKGQRRSPKTHCFPDGESQDAEKGSEQQGGQTGQWQRRASGALLVLAGLLMAVGGLRQGTYSRQNPSYNIFTVDEVPPNDDIPITPIRCVREECPQI